MMMVGIQVHGQYVPIACAVSNKEVNQVFEFVFQVIKIMITMLWFCTKIKLYVSVDCWSCCIATLSAYGWRGSSQSHSGGKGVAEHQTIDVLRSCQVKNFFSAPNYYLCIFVQESCSKKVCPYRCLWQPSLSESTEGSPHAAFVCCGPRSFLSAVWTFPGNENTFTFSHQIATM